MSQRREYPVGFVPKGLSDAFDSTQAFPGACSVLKNLVFDQANPEQVVARPGVGTALTTFASFSSPGAISIQQTIGSVVYGMIASSLTAGYDQPFAYNLATSSFVTISGITAGNVPLTQATSGDWTPPTMAVVGPNLVITHPGFDGATNYFGVIDISNPSAPTWWAGNTSGFGLPSVPVAVSNFGNRAYFACGNNAYYSDILVPKTMTYAGQALTVGDTTSITGFSGLPITTSTAGVVASLMVFKGFQVWQVTGDEVNGDLVQNFLSLTTGCSSPRTIVATPIGVIFIAINGPCYVSNYGAVLPLTNGQMSLTPDIRAPFQQIVNPGRAAASFCGNIYRVCIDTNFGDVNSTNDYWFDITTRRWTGPHSWPNDCSSQYKNKFVISSRNTAAALYFSETIPTPSSLYADNGVGISVELKTSFLPKMQNINVKEVIESTVEISGQASSGVFQINALNENYSVLSSAAVLPESNANAVKWAASLWGAATWVEEENEPSTLSIPWDQPLVFKKLAIQFLATASYYLSIGAFFAKYKNTGYTNIN